MSNITNRLYILDRIIPKNYSETMRDIAECLYLSLINEEAGLLDINDEQAAQLAISQAEFLQDGFSGDQIYIPKVGRLKIMKRDYEIYKKFNGTNYRELAQEYRLSTLWIRRIIASIQEEEFGKKQGALDLNA